MKNEKLEDQIIKIKSNFNCKNTDYIDVRDGIRNEIITHIKNSFLEIEKPLIIKG